MSIPSPGLAGLYLLHVFQVFSLLAMSVITASLQSLVSFVLGFCTRLAVVFCPSLFWSYSPQVRSLYFGRGDSSNVRSWPIQNPFASHYMQRPLSIPRGMIPSFALPLHIGNLPHTVWCFTPPPSAQIISSGLNGFLQTWTHSIFT